MNFLLMHFGVLVHCILMGVVSLIPKQDNPVDILECLSVMVDESTENDAGQVQELILDDQLLGTMVTAITLPDGTQAFVTNNLGDVG